MYAELLELALILLSGRNTFVLSCFFLVPGSVQGVWVFLEVVVVVVINLGHS
jgi:hypothetical protein